MPTRTKSYICAALFLIGIAAFFLLSERRAIESRRTALLRVGEFVNANSQPSLHRWLLGPDEPRFAEEFHATREFTNDTIPLLCNASHLSVLSLSQSQVDDDGLASLTSLTQLRSLRLIGTDVHGPGLWHLVSLPNLEQLELSDTKVSDSAIAAIRELKHLRWLGLFKTNITDTGLKELRTFTNLEGVRLYSNGIFRIPPESKYTKDGIQSLANALPNLSIY